MKDKIIDLLYKYRTDFSLNGMYTEFGIREENFEDLANEIEKIVIEKIKSK